jgi:hypothetical protein
MASQKDIKYIGREFGDFKSQLEEFAKNYFPDTYNDFSETSPGMMFIEMSAYIGDVLSFYQDTQLQETFLQHAQNPSNLYTLAYMMGYRPKVSSASEVELTVTQQIGAIAGLPNWDQALKLNENSTFKSTTTGNTSFISTNAVDFKFSSSYDPTEITIEDAPAGVPRLFNLTKTTKAFSGEIKTLTRTFTTAEKYTTVEVDDTDILNVLSITDSDGNEWTEVPFLGQDTVYVEEANNNSDNNLTPSILKVKTVPRRYVTRFTSKGVLQIQFGAGVSTALDREFLPDPTEIEKFTTQDRVDKIDTAYDPSNFLFTRTYGLAPNNTTLTIKYVVGGGVQANCPAGSITSKNTISTQVTDDTYINTLAVTNLKPASGGKDGDTVEELRQNALRSFAEQKRTVTLQDYTVRSLSLPTRFGSIAKAYVTKENIANASSMLDINPLALSVYTLAFDNEQKLITPNITLKTNLKTYLSQYMLLTDAVDIKDAFVINIGVKFDVLTIPNYASRDVLLNCTNAVKEFFNIKNWNINQPINLSNLFTVLDQIKGVQTVKSIRISNKAGGNYSQYAYDTEGATKDNIVYPSYDPSIFEVKYPDIDIEGRVTTL